MKVLVSTYRTAGDRIALASVRGLAQANARIFLSSDDLSSPSFRSRHPEDRIVIPNPIADRAAYLQGLASEARSRGIDVVLPTDDYAVHALAQSAAGMGLHAPVPAARAYEIAHDKWATRELAERVGIRTPATWRTRDIRDVSEACTAAGYPLVLKIRRGNGSVGLAIVDDAAAIERYFSNRPDFADPVFDFHDVLVQEYVSGETHDLCALFDRGRPVAGLTSRRILTWPREAGAGILVETTRNSDIMDQGLALLSALQWNGPAQVEFKIDGRDGKPTLIEINGRLWGTLALSLAAGVNFPAIACRLALGEPVEERFDYPSGIRQRWLLPYVTRLGWDRGGLAAMWQLLRPRANCRSDLARDDPGPFLALLPVTLSLRRAWHSQLSPLSLGVGSAE